MVVHNIDFCAGALDFGFTVACRTFGVNGIHGSKAQEAAKQSSNVFK